MAGWIPTPADRWLEHRLAITCEWPETLVVLDLRFWDDPIACGKRKRPSSRKLAAVWGWSSTRVLKFIRGGEWQDEHRKSNATATQEQRSPDARATQEHRNGGAVDAAGTPAVDENARKSNAVATQEQRSGDANATQSRRSPDAAPIETRAQSPTPSQAPPPHPTSTEDKVSASPPAVAGLPFGRTAPKADKPAKVNKRAAAQRIYEAYRLHHLDEPEVPSKGDGRKITTRLTELAQQFKGKRRRYTPEDWATAEQDLIDLSEWIHTAPDASFWQGDNDRNREYLGITPIFKTDKFSDRLKSMRAWRKGGRGTKAKTYSGDRGDIPPAPEPQGPQTTGPQWKRLGELDDIVKDKASTAEQVDAALAEIELIESNPGAPLP